MSDLPTFRQTERKPFYKQIKPAGWILIGILLVGLMAMGGLAINAVSGRGIKPLKAGTTPTPAMTATPQPSPTPATTWQAQLYRVDDPITGKAYLAAPETIEREVIAEYKRSNRWTLETEYQVKDFAPDGAACTLGVKTGNRVTLHRMRYTRQQGWQVDALLAVFIQSEEQR